MSSSPPLLAPRADAPPRSGKAVAAMVLGIIGLVLGFLVVPLLCAVLAVVLGSLALQDMGRRPLTGRGEAVAGLVLGIVALAGWAAVAVLVATLGNLGT